MPDINGQRHLGHDGVVYEYCENEDEDWNQGGCAVHGQAILEYKIQACRWTSTMLDYFWENGVEEDGLKFLESGQFILRYE